MELFNQEQLYARLNYPQNDVLVTFTDGFVHLRAAFVLDLQRFQILQPSLWLPQRFNQQFKSLSVVLLVCLEGQAHAPAHFDFSHDLKKPADGSCGIIRLGRLRCQDKEDMYAPATIVDTALLDCFGAAQRSVMWWCWRSSNNSTALSLSVCQKRHTNSECHKPGAINLLLSLV